MSLRREMNKKGHVGTLLMFFGALVLTGTALFSFAVFKNDFSYMVSDMIVVSNQIDFAQKYSKYVFEDMVKESFQKTKNVDADGFVGSFKEEFEKIALERNLNDGITDNLFEKINKGEYEVTHESVIISEVTSSAKSGENEISSNFDLEFEFNKLIS